MFFICLVIYIHSFLHYLIFDRFIHFWLFLQNSFYSLRFFPLFFHFYIHFYILFLFFISSDRYFLFFLKFCCIRVLTFCIDFLFSFLNTMEHTTQKGKQGLVGGNGDSNLLLFGDQSQPGRKQFIATNSATQQRTAINLINM